MRGTLKERFEAKTRRVKGGHLMWTATVNPGGYGMIGHERKVRTAHRVAWELAHGAVPKGLCVLHRCDTPGCVAVDHLFLGTYAENNRDMAVKGRHANTKKTHCPKGHPYSGSNLRVKPSGRRRCLTCHSARNVKSRGVLLHARGLR
jgi:hypothetical protein